MSLKLLAVFTITELVLCMTPGPAVLLVVSRAMRSGFTFSLRSAAGILTGNTIYFVLSALGLGAVLLASQTLFSIIKWAGAAYLIAAGVRMLFASKRRPQETKEADPPPRSVRLFSEGLLTQLSNPKALVFFSALLPQFVTPGVSVPGQFAVLGLLSLVVELIVLTSYAWAADRGSRLMLGARFLTLPDRIAGGFLIAAGVGLAAMRRV